MSDWTVDTLKELMATEFASRDKALLLALTEASDRAGQKYSVIALYIASVACLISVCNFVLFTIRLLGHP